MSDHDDDGDRTPAMNVVASPSPDDDDNNDTNGFAQALNQNDDDNDNNKDDPTTGKDDDDDHSSVDSMEQRHLDRVQLQHETRAKHLWGMAAPAGIAVATLLSKLSSSGTPDVVDQDDVVAAASLLQESTAAVTSHASATTATTTTTTTTASAASSAQIHHFGVGRRGVDSGRDNHLDCHQAAVPVTTATAVVAAAAVAGNWMWTESLDIPYTFPNVTQAVEQRAVLTIDFVAPIAPLDDNENASTTTTILRPLFLDEGAVLESLFASTYNDVLGGCDSLFGRVVTTATLDCDDTTCCQLVSNDNNNAVWGDTKVQCNLTARFWCQDNCTSLFGTEDDEGEFVISTTITVESSNTDEPTTSSTSSNPESTTLATTTPSQPKMTNNAVVGASQQQSLNVFAFTQQPPPRPIDQASTSSSVMSSSSYTKLQSTFVTQK